MAGKLVICPTPLGNLGDMTPRALDALRAADVVCAEDTRVTGKLLAALGVEGKRLERLDENVIAARAAEITARIIAGETIAYCTDAGMPGVSDPGLRLVRTARVAGVPVDVLPGPTAVATAYVASGCVDQSFYFGGFFPRKDAARVALLKQLKLLDAAFIFYESPNRLVSALESIAQVLPLREVAVCRELTKLHEEVFRGPVPQVLVEFADRDSVKGEIVIVVDGPTDAEREADAATATADAAARARELASQGMRPKDITRALVSEFHIPRNEAYDLALHAN
ncbi:MAG: 16S rRNA (cytidine(1402)-2'-O)-methyltransferase [Eggerthellaceae bacterium]|nr:16S rRNA (cytidine(1402)-2'-O)-methyltransferase [Eggerthellaceae bacterium]